MQDFLVHFAYMGIIVALVGRGIGLPLPEDVSLLTIGFLCTRGICDLQIAIPLSLACIVLADTLSFLGGRHFGHHLPRVPLLRWILTHAHLSEAEQFYRKHGVKALIGARLLPGLRSPLFFIAGASGVRFAKFFFLDLLIAPFNVGLLIFLGWTFPSHLSQLKETLGTTQLILLLLCTVAAVLSLLARWRKKRSTNSPSLPG